MKTKRFNVREQMEKGFAEWMNAKAYRLLGIFWTKYVSFYRDPVTLDIVFEYE